MTSDRRFAGYRRDRALVPAHGRRVPQIYLGRTQGELPEVYLSEPGEPGTGLRLKWLLSTCLAGTVGVCLIAFTVYASMKADDGAGVVNTIRRASLAALKPMQSARIVADNQTAAGHKSDLIHATTAGLSTRHIIHDSVVQHRGNREFIGIKPYARVVARLATAQPESSDEIPPFNPFKLFANPTPIGDGDSPASDSAVQVTMSDLVSIPREDGIELRGEEVARLVAQANQTLLEAPYAMRSSIAPDGDGLPIVKAAYQPYAAEAEHLDAELPPNTTTVEKLDADDSQMPQVAEIKSVKVRKGDTILSILENAGAERWQARAIADAMAPIFPPSSLMPGQEVRFSLVPAPSDTGQMEPLRISIFSGDEHRVSVARNEAGEYVASDEPIELHDDMLRSESEHATLYTSFYQSALLQKLPNDMIMKLLRIHSYDVDFKQRVHPGDTFEAFFDLRDGENGPGTEPGELLYTSMTVGGQRHDYYRFRTPDGVVDFYDAEGNSARKFLMRQPVKGSRFTSSFGSRNHPLLGYKRMHTGVDWAAPSGTPILAAGSGVVETVERRSGYGNYVRIKHANGYKTAYAHMRGFADGMRPGVKVEQGQVIGYVGSTGLSTGPHLHFEVLVNNRFVNPMTIHVPQGRQLTGRLLAEFMRERNRIDELMQRSPVTTQVAAVAN